ncbi:MAG: acetyl-CoA hydrolase, partial [Sphingobium sp.]
MTVTTDLANLDLGRYLKAGDRIVFGQACGEPTTLVKALVAQGAGIGGLSAFIATSFSGLFTPETAESFSLSSMGAIGALRSMTRLDAEGAGKLSVIPVHVSQVGPMIAAGIIGCDVAMIQVSPADADGFHSFGLIGDHTRAMVDKARVVIAEVNDQVPHVPGERLAASEIDVAVPVSRTPVEVAPAKIGETDEAIAKFAAAYIGDGSVIQTGVGAVPDAILRLLHDRRDLGVHSGMLGDGLVELVEAGVITNARKAIDAGVSVNGAFIGTRKLYDWANGNKAVRLCSTAYTHDAATLARL